MMSKTFIVHYLKINMLVQFMLFIKTMGRAFSLKCVKMTTGLIYVRNSIRI